MSFIVQFQTVKENVIQHSFSIKRLKSITKKFIPHFFCAKSLPAFFTVGTMNLQKFEYLLKTTWMRSIYSVPLSGIRHAHKSCYHHFNIYYAIFYTKGFSFRHKNCDDKQTQRRSNSLLHLRCICKKLYFF